MFRPQKTVASAAGAARRALARLARPSGEFQASRYFRGGPDLGFYNTGTGPMRALSRDIYVAHRDRWRLSDALAFADRLMPDRHLEAKAVCIEVVSRYRREFAPHLLPRCKRWLAKNYASNWATTDHMCGAIIGPLLVRYPHLVPRMLAWSRHRNMWVRRASIVGLLKPMHGGDALDVVYAIAGRLHPDGNDLIDKAVGWALREAGKADVTRLERYLRDNVGIIPRTTFRYAIERFPAAKRRRLLKLR